MQKRILIIQDLSAVGRVSASVAIPILASSGLITTLLPTALLSTHSGGFEGFSFLDLTQEMGKILDHWETTDLRFDAVQTGYLGSPCQAREVERAIGLAQKDAEIIVDPAMADNGRLYSKISKDMVEAMKSLCKKATIIIPNLTEATFLTGKPYEDKHEDQGYILDLARELYRQLGVKNIIITGVSNQEGSYGAACYQGEKDQIYYSQKPKIKGHYYGTGDIFASVLTASVENHKTIEEALDIATEFTHRTIQQSFEQKLPQRYGVCFEPNIPWLIKKLDL